MMVGDKLLWPATGKCPASVWTISALDNRRVTMIPDTPASNGTFTEAKASCAIADLEPSGITPLAAHS